MSHSKFWITALFISLSLFVLCLPALSQQSDDYNSFKPGGVWFDSDGVHIDCHGGNIIFGNSLAQGVGFKLFYPCKKVV
jgi:beta-galactosidase